MKASTIFRRAAIDISAFRDQGMFRGCCDAIHLSSPDVKTACTAIDLMLAVFDEEHGNYIWRDFGSYLVNNHIDHDSDARIFAMLLMAEMFKGKELTKKLKP